MNNNTKDVKIADYQNAIVQLTNHFNHVPDFVRPISIIQNGNIGTAGVSDIDLIFVFPDDFDSGNEFAAEYQKAVDPIKHKEVFFVHQPMLLSKSATADLPYFTHNPVKELNVVFGDTPVFSISETPPVQAILISLEFIQFRLFQLVNQLMTHQTSLQGVLLRGHSLKHSLTLSDRAGLDFGGEKFSAFGIIESIRASINKGEKIKLSEEELTNLYKGIIREFYIVYKRFCNRVESFVSFYLPPADSYEYEANIYLSGLFDEKNLLNRTIGNNSMNIDGFHWANMLLRDIYFEYPNVSSLICDNEFMNECLKRAENHKIQWSWNKRNFNNIHAGLSPMPCVIGKQAQKYAKNHWGI